MLKLDINLLWTVVNVLVLFLLLRKFLYKPVMNIIAQRQKQVDDALAAAETSKKEAAATLNTAQDKLRNVDAEAAARRTAYEEQAEKQVKLHLALEEVAKLEGFEVTDEDVEAEMKKIAENYSVELEKVKGLIKAEDVKKDILSNKALDVVKNSAVVEEKNSTAKKTAAKKDAE